MICLQGSSPVAQGKDVAEADAAAETESVDTGRGEPGAPGAGPKRQGIANIRPLYSIYIPQSRTESTAPVLIPGAALDRTTSLPTTPERVYEPRECS